MAKSEMKFTKGPWEIRDDGTMSAEWVEVLIDSPHYDDGSELVIAKLGTVRTRDGETPIELEDAAEIYANAHLIAAAPEMYEALEECREYFSDREDADHNGERYIANREMQLGATVAAALAKAVSK